MDATALDLTPRGTASIEALVNGPIQTNSYAVISSGECLIIDPAWEGERASLRISESNILACMCSVPFVRTVTPIMLVVSLEFAPPLALTPCTSCAART